MTKKSWYYKLIKGIPNPKIRVREGAGKVFLEYMLTPLTELEIEGKTLLETEKLIKHKKSDIEKIKSHKLKTYSLFFKR